MASYVEFIQEIFGELNNLRTDPKGFAERMEFEFVSTFKENNARHRFGAVPIITKEGIKAVQEAIEYLKSVEPLGGLAWSEGLARAAQSHVNDTGPLGIVGHTGSRENNLGDRLSQFGKWSDCIGECLDYSSVNAFEVIVSFVIDDGLPTRPHRKIVMNPRFKKVGIGAGHHTEYRSAACIVFAGEFAEKEELENVEIPQGNIQTFPEIEN
mmetsp:Transcript_19970/g.20017  ORF Transcript_19970/g.20017 Transcript_19970/m.20017 type:complete len:211 (+) Transcript_19970:25-657(+)|eukprot:CAMPEP_0202944374 /NCGR_PEP_ID=MMETSP1395-20130829/5155_1 /ASSEMBLY_ACC=CAM_ASM_000871 /TAXON_ID=5961 /ORGANISM="Blepharisma japonicum, Strain Stock R1072" /LENGTH=210 /DNA_ID=CAMNT_0049643115 /DNA_START=12 /DNA_END=644 /DNA_ORIENTATION=-